MLQYRAATTMDGVAGEEEDGRWGVLETHGGWFQEEMRRSRSELAV
jgi:hypothetical protein